jgi:hypothetical protein
MAWEHLNKWDAQAQRAEMGAVGRHEVAQLSRVAESLACRRGLDIGSGAPGQLMPQQMAPRDERIGERAVTSRRCKFLASPR